MKGAEPASRRADARGRGASAAGLVDRNGRRGRDQPGAPGVLGETGGLRLDECGALTTLSRLRGRSPRGERACASAPFGHWTRLTVLGALGAEGIVGAMSVEAATSAAVFLAKPHRGLRRAYLDQVLLPALRRSRPDAVPVMDNLAAHKTAQVRALLDRSGFACRYLPPYSPDLSPIEPGWAKVKAALRRAAARTEDALHEALGPALAAITSQDAAGFFGHCGYERGCRNLHAKCSS